MTDRIYIIRDMRGDSRARLVRAASKAQALRHVAEDVLLAQVAGQNDLVFHLGQGVEVECAATAKLLSAAAEAADDVPDADRMDFVDGAFLDGVGGRNGQAPKEATA